jgi:hypothetical protein
MAKGLPDAAWDPIEGDDRGDGAGAESGATRKKRRAVVLHELRQRSRPSQSRSRSPISKPPLTPTCPQSSPKEQTWEQILGSAEYRQQKLAADAWCAAFVWPKEPGALRDAAPTVAAWRALAAGKPVEAKTLDVTAELAARYEFLPLASTVPVGVRAWRLRRRAR